MRTPFQSTTSVARSLYALLPKLILLLIVFAGLQLSSAYSQTCIGTEYLIDFELKPDGSPFKVGEIITNQYEAAYGITFSSRNSNGTLNASNPLVIFDSSDPDFGVGFSGDASNGDCDLGTPSFNCTTRTDAEDATDNCDGAYPGKGGGNNAGGQTNCSALGNLLIFEEHFVDQYNNDSIAKGNTSTNMTNPDWLGAPDGHDDSPDDRASGGFLQIDFANAFDLTQIGFVDDAAGIFTVTKSDNSTETVTFHANSDNDTALVNLNIDDVVKIVFDQDASGAISSFRFCDRVTAEIGDQLYIDNNKNGIYEPAGGDTPIANVDVILTLSDGSKDTVTTGSDGKYLFPNLFAGTYTVTVDVTDSDFPAEYYATVDADGIATPNRSVVTIIDQESNLTQDFGYAPIDLTCESNETQGILDWDLVTWIAGETSNTFTFGNTEVTVSSTSSNFGTNNPGITNDQNNAGGINGSGSALQTNTDAAGTITTKLTFDYPVKNLRFSIHDIDLSDNAIITSNNGAPTAILFEGSSPNFDIISNTQIQGSGSNAANSPNGTANIYFEQEVSEVTIVTSRSGATLFTALGDVIACTVNPASVGDFTFTDYDNDGIFNNNDVLLAGVPVSLQIAGGGSVTDLDGNLVTATTTDINGEYNFGNLPPGSYEVVFGAVAGFNRALQNQGSDDTKDSDANPLTGVSDAVTLAAGDNNTTIDAGYVGQGSIGDQLFVDLDNNGVFNPAIDSVITNVTVTLTLPGGAMITDVTDVNGKYLFENLPVGAYTVTVNTADPDFPVGVTNSIDPNGGNNNTSNLSLTLGNIDRLDQDFGYAGGGSIGDQLYEDVDGNGMYDVNVDNALDGVTVSLKLPNGAIITTDTDANGQYLFEKLTPGDYMVIVDESDLSAELVNTVDPDGLNNSMSSLTLGIDEENLDQDFGYVSPVSIGDFTFIDYNKDGLQTNDDPIGGVQVTLFKQGGGVILDLDGNAVGPTTTDAVTGLYLFDNLPPGIYRVVFGSVTDYNRTIINAGSNDAIDSDANVTSGNSPFYTLNSGEDTLVVDAGYIGTGTIGDQFFVDVNGDGIYTLGTDEPIGGVLVTLTLPNGQTLTTTTDAVTGTYSFTGLAPGDYSVSYDAGDIAPALVQTVEGDATINNMAALTLGLGETNNDQDFGFVAASSIGDFTFTDYDNDGIFNNNDVLLAGVPVSITNADGSTVTDLSGTTVASTTTGVNGKYLFDNLAPGNYIVTFGEPIGYDRALLNQGNDEALDSDANEINGKTATIVLPSGVDSLTVDAGYIGKGSIGDQLFVDLDNDGAFDAAIDSVIANVTVTLTLPTGGTVTMETGSDGKYLFSNLPPTSGMQMYVVTVDINDTDFPAGVANSIDPDGGNDNTADLTLAANENNLTQDFGYVGTSSVGNTVWFDTVLNGIYDNTVEDGVEGVTVNLYNSKGELIGTDITDVNGQYLIDSLLGGEYYVEFIAPDGLTFTSANQGNGANDSDVTGTNGPRTTNSFLLRNGEYKDDVDAGLINTVVPVELTYFSGEALDNANLLEWETAVEIDNDFFEIQRMVQGGKSYEVIGKVAGNGNITDIQSYSFQDRNVGSGVTHLYRLKQVDFNGNFEFSNIVKIERREDQIDIKLYPNPTTDFINIDLGKNLDQNARIQLLNSQGQVLRVISIDEESSSIRIDVTNLTSGNYYINIIKDNLTFNKTFIKI